MKEISIIMPVYNAEQYIENTLLSIVNQTFKGDFELIIINDGSKDNSAKIIGKYISKYPKLISLVNKENKGVSSARNIGLNMAQGKYITFIDSDDIYEPDYLEKLYDTIQQGYDMVSCNYENFGANNNKISIDMEFETIDIGTYVEKLQSNYLFNQLWNKIYLAKIIKDNNIIFDVNKSIAEDWEFNIKYISKCNCMKHINENLYRYRVSNEGLGFKYRKDANSIKLEILEETKNIFEEKNIKTDYLDKCYIIQIFSFFSVIMDPRNNMNHYEKKMSIKDFISTKKYNEIINSININKCKYNMMLFLLKTKCVFLFCMLGIIANKYDRYKKRKTFGI